MEVQALEHQFARRSHQARRLERAELFDRLAEARYFAQSVEILGGRRVVGNFDAPSALEVGGYAAQVVDLEITIEDLEHGAIDEAFDEVLFLLVLAHILELDFARG